MTAPLQPFRLDPLLVEKPWGGRELARLGRRLPDGAHIGESWDLADLDESMTPVPDPISRVLDGPFTGRRLRDVVQACGAELLGAGFDGAQRFPLLVKHLDAREHLSVQVHPTAEVVARHPGTHLKTESWVVVRARRRAGILLGVRPHVTIADLEATLGSPALVPLLRYVPVRAGDVYHVPAGVIHALGAGVVVAEVQTPSDTTFRLYDWTAEYGRAPRALHADLALESVRSGWRDNVEPPAPSSSVGVLIRTEHYVLARRRCVLARELSVPERPTARVMMVSRGRVVLDGLGGAIERGGMLVLPAAWAGTLRAEARTAWLEVDLVAPAG
jgi:mannose-6-phosphate isomerase